VALVALTVATKANNFPLTPFPLNSIWHPLCECKALDAKVVGGNDE